MDEDGDDSFLPNALEITQIGDDEQLLNDSDIQAEITSDTEVSADTENLDSDTQDNTEIVVIQLGQLHREQDETLHGNPSGNWGLYASMCGRLMIMVSSPRGSRH